MNLMKKILAGTLLGIMTCAPAIAGEPVKVNDPLLQKMVEKGTLTAAEAEEIQSKKVELPSALKGLSIGGLSYIDYSFGQAAQNNYNRFTLQRVYINVNKEITPWFKARITPDITAGADKTGDYTIRMKYAYADFLPSDLGYLTDTTIRAGLEQTPFLEFEEALNGYRMQSPMFQDKRGIITSSDLGISMLGNIAGKLGKKQTEALGNSKFAGRYGTYSIGVYNGGGYSAANEKNHNKSIQARLTIRPLPDMLPGLQLTYFGITGEDNDTPSATGATNGKTQKWTNKTGLISYQHRLFVLSGEYMRGKGSFKGDTATAKDKSGYSIFGKIILPVYEKAAFFARYDSFDPDKNASNDRIKTTIGGASYRIYGDNYLVAAYEKTHTEGTTYDDKKGQIVLQVAF